MREYARSRQLRLSDVAAGLVERTIRMDGPSRPV
jgi:hypothetical protein